MLYSNDSPPDVARFPAPWSLRGHAWMVVLRLPVGDPARTAFVPADLRATVKSAFAVLMLLGRGGWPARTAALVAGLIGYGVLIEVCQHTLTTNRVGEFRDVVADGLGVAIGWLLGRSAALQAVLRHSQ